CIFPDAVFRYGEKMNTLEQTLSKKRKSILKQQFFQEHLTMKIILWVPLLSLLMMGQIVHADEIVLVDAPVRIPVGQTQTFEFGTVPQLDTTVLLKIHSRLDSTGLGGSMFFMRIRLNGRDVQAAKSRTAMRLVNRSIVSPVAPNVPSTWY